MKQKSWHLNRREFLRGGGAALALPFLNGMSWAAGAPGGKPLPKARRIWVDEPVAPGVAHESLSYLERAAMDSLDANG